MIKVEIDENTKLARLTGEKVSGIEILLLQKIVQIFTDKVIEDQAPLRNVNMLLRRASSKD